MSIPLGTFDSDPEEYLDKSPLFNLTKASEEKVFDAILEKIPNNDKYYVKHCEGKMFFQQEKTKHKFKKTKLLNLLKLLIQKLKKSTNISGISRLK